MRILEFEDFMFSPNTLELYLRGEPVGLRPKTAVLLRVLLGAQPKCLSKRDIIEAVWQREWVSEQNLFQAMSELRRALAPLKPIKTFPNKGYQWVLPVRANESADGNWQAPARLISTPVSANHNTPPWQRIFIAASLSAAILFAGMMIGAANQPVSNKLAAIQVRTLSPALIAFTNGLAKLETGQVAQAERYFRLSVDENPEFLEAQLLLSEALLRQGRVDDARQRALQLINRENAHQDTYTVIAAMDLISRSDQVAGQSSSAMEWAIAAADQAHTEGFVCAAANLDERLSILLAVAAADVSSVLNTALPVEDAASTRANRATMHVFSSQKTAATLVDLGSSQRCEQMRAPISAIDESTTLLGDKTIIAKSHCAPARMDSFLALINSDRRPADKVDNSLV